MVEEQVVEQPVQQEQPASTQTDPFAIDETRFASLSPEQRAALDPVLNDWKAKATGEIEKRSKTYEEKYKPSQEKAQALEELVKNQEFQRWWASQQNSAMQGQNPDHRAAIQRTQPQDFASAEEWSKAVAEAYAGNPQLLKEIQGRMFAVMATPVVQQLQQGQQELKMTLEMRDLFERHPDAKLLDSVGRDLTDPNDKSVSLLEMALTWADDKGKTIEEGYQMAKKWSDAMKVGAQQEALGIVQGKKDSVTSGPLQSRSGGVPVVEVNDLEELMNKSQEALLNGDTKTKFVIRQREPVTGTSRWTQRT